MITEEKSILEILKKAIVINMDAAIIKSSLDDSNTMNLNYNFNINPDGVQSVKGN